MWLWLHVKILLRTSLLYTRQNLVFHSIFLFSISRENVDSVKLWQHKLLSCALRKNPLLSFGTSRNSLIPSHTFNKSSTILSFLPVLFPICLQSSLGESIYLMKQYDCTLIPSHTFPMSNSTLNPSYILPKSSTVLSLGLVFL